jgi:DNA-binding transcriptional MerR regulator
MRIGELATAAGIKVTTIRFYEAERLLAPPARTAANYRSYPTGAVQRVRFIRRAQQLGFSLSEIRAFLGTSDATAVEGRALRAYATTKLDDLAGRVRDLQRMQRGIRRLMARGRVDGPCPILEALAPCPRPDS